MSFSCPADSKVVAHPCLIKTVLKVVPKSSRSVEILLSVCATTARPISRAVVHCREAEGGAVHSLPAPRSTTAYLNHTVPAFDMSSYGRSRTNSECFEVVAVYADRPRTSSSRNVSGHSNGPPSPCVEHTSQPSFPSVRNRVALSKSSKSSPPPDKLTEHEHIPLSPTTAARHAKVHAEDSSLDC
jgi:hypothetical protein